MRGFTTIDLYFMTKELQSLIGGRIDKIYQLGEDLYISIYVTSKGKKLLKVKPDKIWVTKYKPEFEELPHFAETLRRFLNNARIKEIKQINSERILEITLGKEDEFKLYMEFFSTGNIILEKDSKIMGARIEKAWKDRKIRRGQEYQRPPEAEDVLNITESKIKEKIKNEIVSKVLAKSGFGKEYAFEICTRAKIDPKQKNADPKAVMKAIKEIIGSEMRPQVYYEKDKAVLATPIPFISRKNKSITTQTFSAAIEIVEKKPVKKDKTQQEKEKIERIIKKQEEDIKKLEEKSAKERRKAEMIYERYAEIKEIVDKIKAKKIQEIPENVKVDWDKKKVKIKLE